MKGSWIILSPIEQSIKRKIERIGTPLKEWNITINYGIKTGCNDAFLISGEKRKQLIEEDPKSAEIIQPILRGMDVGRYTYNFADRWLIATFPSRHYNIDNYPAVKSHLLAYGKERLEQSGLTHIINGEKITSRKKTQNKWFETQDSISYWDDFSKQKIVYSEIVQTPQFYLDNDNNFYVLNTGYILTGDNIEFICACLNSKLYSFCFKKYYSGGRLGNHGYRYLKAFIETLPLPIINKKTVQKIKKLVLDMNGQINNDVFLQNSESIENILYQAVSLNKEEISYIENSQTHL